MTEPMLSRRMPLFSDKHTDMSNKPDSKQLLELKARAHHLNPVVMIGQQGLTESVIKETDAALTAHELIKVRVLGDDRAERSLVRRHRRATGTAYRQIVGFVAGKSGRSLRFYSDYRIKAA